VSRKIQNKYSITLVVLARNEAGNIGPLLQSLASVIDETIVVDTGSTDTTVAEAQQAGASVVSFPWCDDFSRARNFGIEAATGNWILTVDADERIDSADFSAISEATQSSGEKGYFFTQRNYTELRTHPQWRPINGRYPDQEKNLNGYIEAHQIRLFPNLSHFRYRGCIHETVDCPTRNTEHLEVTVHHFGHLKTGEPAKRRNDLYSRLTRKKLHGNPDDADACFQMATRYLEEGRLKDACLLFHKLAGMTFTDQPAITRGHLAHGRIFLAEGKIEAALEKFELAVQQQPRWLQCWLETISLLVEESRWSEAGRYISGARMLFPEEALLWRFECRLMVATGDFENAAEKARALARKFPHWQGAQNLSTLCNDLARLAKEKPPEQ